MNSLPSHRTPRALIAIIGGLAAVGALVTASAAQAADAATPQIVMIDPAANLSSVVRAEERRGNDVDATFRAIGKGFVADLDKADIARLEMNPDVLLIEPDRPVRATYSPGSPVPDVSDAVAPANDPFSAPVTVSGSAGSLGFVNTGASRETGEPHHGAPSGSASVWFTWTAPETGSLTVTTAGSRYDTLLAAYTGSAVGSLTQLAANDDVAGGTTSAITIPVTAGTTYRIAVDGWGGRVGTGTLTWALTTSSAPSNDAFASPSEITGAGGTAPGKTVGASRESGEPAHGGDQPAASIWYRWTATATGTLNLNTQGSNYDTLLGVYTGPGVNALTTLATNDDVAGGGGLWSQVRVPVTEGTTYAIAIDGWRGARGQTVLNWSIGAPVTPTPPPAPTPPAAPGTGAPQNRAAVSWGQDRIDQPALPMDGRIAAPLDGSGVTTYVIDTGVRADHDDFGGRVQAGFDAVDGTDATADCNGHGTHVAGTVAGTTFGVAPAASVVPVRVLDCSGSGTTSGVIAGINWAASHHAAGTPAVANMSLGGGYSPALNSAVRAAVADGITFAVAAGNSSANACGASPASEPTAITVGATGSNDWRAPYSNFGSCLDVFAPGSGIISASSTSSTGSRSLSGTSMASPHVAGAAALLLSGSPGATPQAVADAIAQGATQGVVTDVVGSPNRLLNINGGVLPAPPAPALTPTPAPGPVTGTNPVTPGTPATPSGGRRVGARETLAAPRLVSATRTRTGLAIRITTSEGATGYQVFVNGRMAGRITGARGTVKTSAARRAKVQVRAVNPTSSSALSNAVSS